MSDGFEDSCTIIRSFSSRVNCSYKPRSFFVEASHERSDVDTVDSRDTISFTVLLANSIHEDGKTLDKEPQSFGSIVTTD